MVSKKWVVAAVLATGASGAAQAGYIDTTFSSGTTSLEPNAVIYDFDSGMPAGYSGDGWILPTSDPGYAAAPAGDSTPFLTVAFPQASGAETFQAAPGTLYNYFGLYWGSIDAYNSLSFYNGNTLLGSFTGNDVIQAGAAFGDPVSAGSNQYVNFFLNGLWFDRIVFSTSTYAFESDNHAFAAVPAPVPVPEPGTLALMGVGMAGLLLTRRRRTANVGI